MNSSQRKRLSGQSTCQQTSACGDISQNRLGSGRRIQWTALIWFFGPALILLAAACLVTGQDGEVRLPLFDVQLPETCALKARFGIACPGCGLTRSFVYLAHGELMQAYQIHSLGLLVFAYVVGQLPLALMHWHFNSGPQQPSKRWSRLIWLNERLLLVLAALLAIRWLLRMLGGNFT